MPTVNVKNGEIRYVKFGSGKRVMVILPGLSLKSLDTYADAVEGAFSSFCDDYTVYVFDRVTQPPDGYTVYSMADDIAEAMQMLGLRQCCIFGASQGGMIAQCIAVKYPDLVSKLALGSSCCRMNGLFEQTVTEWGRLAKKGDSAELNRSFVYRVYSEKTLEKFGEYLLSQSPSCTADELNRFYLLDTASLGFDLFDEIKKIKCPVLVLGAGQDNVIGVDGSYEIAEQTGAELFVYDDYGHAAYDEAPDYRQRLKDFFDK